MEKKYFCEEYKKTIDKVKSLTQNTNKRSVLIVLQDIKENNNVSIVQSIRESITNIICIVSVVDEVYAEEILTLSKDVIDEVLIDSDNKRLNSDIIKNRYIEIATMLSIPFSFYSDIDTWVSSSVNFIKCVEKSELSSKSILVLGKNILATKMIFNLVSQNINISVLSADYNTKDMQLSISSSVTIQTKNIDVINDCNGLSYDILIGCSVKENYRNLDLLSSCKIKNAYDIGIKNFSKEFIQNHESTNFYRSDDRAGIASAVISIMETNYLVSHNLGRVSFAGINVASGGYVGKDGDVIVDNAFNPSTVLGIANGDGTFKMSLTNKEIETINRVNSII
jgi:hypothetical protein